MCKFPPQGIRGVGSPFAPTYFGMSAPAYQDAANESLMVLVQIETPTGLKNAYEIASVPGIGVFRLALTTEFQRPKVIPSRYALYWTQ